MLTQIHIQGLALVDRLEWKLGSGLLGITGETGAGKSVIVGALKLVLGERADKSLIRTGETSCSVEAMFDLVAPKEVNDLLEASGLDVCEGGTLIVKRVISTTSNRQFVNNSPVTLAMLRLLGEHLVDLHGPHDHQGLLSTDRQLEMLDAYSGSKDLLKRYRSAWSEWKTKQDELTSLEQSERASSQEMDLLKFQVEEIDAAELQPEAEEETEARYKRSANATRLAEISSEVSGLLGGDDGVTRKLSEVQQLAGELQRLDGNTTSLLEGLESAIVELADLESSIQEYTSELEVDPAEASELENRITTFETLKRKYGATLEDVIAHRDKAAARLHNIENRGEVLETLSGEVESLRQKVDALGAKLSSRRRDFAPKLSREIVSHLKDLGFRQSLFELDFVIEKTPSSNGLESVEFQFGPNPGEPLKALRSVASSGEMSRVMLAVKSALAAQDGTPLMVFDEIDANVGGEIACAVGAKMATLGQSHQVIAITHFPQVAAAANEHFVVNKSVQQGRTFSSLKKVEEEARIDELVRMLGGASLESRKMATSLLV